MAIRAVLFDLGNTLWHIPELPPPEQIRGETMRRIFGLLRTWDVEPEGDLRFLGRDIRLAIGAADRAAYESHCLSPDYLEIVHNVAVERGLGMTPERARELWHAWNLEGPFFGRRLYAGAIEMLTTLRGRGYALALVTNRVFSGPGYQQELELFGLPGLFDAMAVSCELGYMKPHPKIFEHALDALGVAPEDAVMVGDSLRADVGGGRALGMTTIWRRLPDVNAELGGDEPHFVVDELSEIPHLPCFGPNGTPG